MYVASAPSGGFLSSNKLVGSAFSEFLFQAVNWTDFPLYKYWFLSWFNWSRFALTDSFGNTYMFQSFSENFAASILLPIPGQFSVDLTVQNGLEVETTASIQIEVIENKLYN